MMKNYFKQLKDIEEYINEDMSTDNYAKTVRSIVSFTEDADNMNSSIGKYLCKHFREDNNTQYTGYCNSIKEVSKNNFKVQKHQASSKMIEIIGRENWEKLIRKETEEDYLNNIQYTLQIQRYKNKAMRDIFIADIVQGIGSVNNVSKVYEFAECENEIQLLSTYYKGRTKNILNEPNINIDKMKYLKSILDKCDFDSSSESTQLLGKKTELLQRMMGTDLYKSKSTATESDYYTFDEFIELIKEKAKDLDLFEDDDQEKIDKKVQKIKSIKTILSKKTRAIDGLTATDCKAILREVNL